VGHRLRGIKKLFSTPYPGKKPFLIRRTSQKDQSVQDRKGDPGCEESLFPRRKEGQLELSILWNRGVIEDSDEKRGRETGIPNEGGRTQKRGEGSGPKTGGNTYTGNINNSENYKIRNGTPGKKGEEEKGEEAIMNWRKD